MNDCLVKDPSFRVHHTKLPVADLDRSVASKHAYSA